LLTAERWIIESVPGRKIVYDWRYRGIPGAGTVSFEISRNGNETVLRVTSQGMDSFPQDVPEFSRESCEGGWKYFIQGNLKRFLDAQDK
jgi:Activator of Hsp90 ATPase homolog 1-like protein